MANKKLMVKGTYRKQMTDGNATTLANYDVEVVVTEVRPDYIRDAVQAILPSKVEMYESLRTCYPQHDTITDTDGQPTVDVVRGSYNPNYGAPEEKREVGPGQGMAELAAAAGEEELKEQRQSPEATSVAASNGQVETVDAIPNKPEPGVTYDAPVGATAEDFKQAETLTPEGSIAAGEGAGTGNPDDDQPPAPAAA